MKVSSIYLALGSNLGDKINIIHATLNIIEERIGEIRSLSTLYYSSPIGFVSSNSFVNCVCEVFACSDIYTIFDKTKAIEKEIGRVDKSLSGRYKDRLIDIDLIMADSLIIKSKELTIPHPRFHLRSFVLVPLCEIAPKLIHPILGKSISQLREELRDNSSLKPIYDL